MRVRDYVVVFGAGVRPDGTPSATLRHRIDGAIAWARRDPRAIVMPTGGVGTHGPAEAVVVRDALIGAGIPSSRIVIEPTGRDTLESVRRCDALLRERGDCRRVVVCTSGYHQIRCAVLFRLISYRVALAPVSNSLDRLARGTYVKAVAKEFVATPYDSLLLWLRR